jgi:hypothetical protein
MLEKTNSQPNLFRAGCQRRVATSDTARAHIKNALGLLLGKSPGIEVM